MRGMTISKPHTAAKHDPAAYERPWDTDTGPIPA